MNQQIHNQLDELLDSARSRIDQVMDEDGEKNESRSEPLCEEWWEWIIEDEIDVVFVPKQFQNDLQLYLDI
jgi:hypothetical protein